MLRRSRDEPASRRRDPLPSDRGPVADAAERRGGNRLLSAWQRARDEAELPSLAALERATEPELMHRTILLRVGPKGALTIERFGPPQPTPGGRVPAAMPAPVTPMVVTWIRSIAVRALRGRAPRHEADEVMIGKRRFCYRCVVVPVSANGTDVDHLVGVLGYRWDDPGPRS